MRRYLKVSNTKWLLSVLSAIFVGVLANWIYSTTQETILHASDFQVRLTVSVHGSAIQAGYKAPEVIDVYTSIGSIILTSKLKIEQNGAREYPSQKNPIASWLYIDKSPIIKGMSKKTSMESLSGKTITAHFPIKAFKFRNYRVAKFQLQYFIKGREFKVEPDSKGKINFTITEKILKDTQERQTMNLTEFLTIAALGFNFIALLIVAYQTSLNRKSLLLTKQSIDEDRKTRQIELLPRAHFIFEVQYHLKKWLEDIENTTRALQDAFNNRDLELLKKISEKALKSPKGLVDKFSYEKGPRWLSEIWLASAQYYYDFNIPLRDLWNERKQEPFWDLAPDLIDRGKEHSQHISNLLGYISQTVPESYASAPAGITDSKFLSD